MVGDGIGARDYHDAPARLGYTFAWNDLDDTIEANSRPIDAGVAAEIRCRMRDWGFPVANHVEDAYTYLAHQHRYHPIKRRLEALTWDGGAHLARLCTHMHDAHPPIVNPDGTALRVAQVWFMHWLLGSVARILQNEAYVGRWYYRKTKRVKDPTTGKPLNVPRPKEEWLELAVPAIVPEELFAAAQQRRASNKVLLGHQHKHVYTLGGMVRCGHCGRAAAGSTKRDGDRTHHRAMLAPTGLRGRAAGRENAV